jgi:DNA polymerase
MAKKEIVNVADAVKNCKKCDLWKTRTKPVIGDGSEDADIMFIGEAPGYNEDKQGLPFVGKAGKILDDLLEEIGMHRQDVYIANILKCRPPKNRNPLKSEIDICTDYLNKQIEIIQPKIIIPLGNFASSFVFEKFGLSYDKISNVHGEIFHVNTLFGDKIIIPMYHPAVATYNPNRKETLSKDFKSIQTALEKI